MRDGPVASRPFGRRTSGERAITARQPRVAIAIAIDNLAEGMSVGELIRDETPNRARALPRGLAWTGTIGLALFVSALLAAGAGAMLYLTLSSLVPEGEARQYQGSATLASGVSFALILVLSALRA